MPTSHSFPGDGPGPQLTDASARSAGGSSAGLRSDFDALTDLFLGDAVQAPAPRVEPSGRLPFAAPDDSVEFEPPSESDLERARVPEVELLVAGHLPVRAAPWSAQYARVAAEQSGAAVLLVRSNDREMSIDALGPGAAELGQAGEIEGVIDLLHEPERVGLVVMQVDEFALAGTVRDERVSRVTVLSGANEAAIVAAYRLLKGLAQSAPGDTPELGVAFVGSSQVDAFAAWEKLRRAVSVFLTRPLSLRGIVSKVAPTGSRTIYRGEGSISPEEFLSKMAPSPVEDRAGEAQDEAFEPVIAVALPETSVAEALPSAAEALRLLARVRALALSCPDDAAAALGVGEDGAIHVACIDVSGDGFARACAAASWARRHAGLIAAASSEIRVDPARPVQAHLFVRDAKSARRLLDTEVRVHALARAPGAWCSVELN